MRYRLLGRSGIKVSPLQLGAMTFGSWADPRWGDWGSSKQDARAVFEAYAEAGGNFVDTSTAYARGDSERWLGEFLTDAGRERFVVASKYSPTVDDNAAGSGDNAKALRQHVDESLRRLNTDFIDVLYLHIWDGLVPIEEVMRTLNQMVQAGKILYPAISDTPAWLVSRANAIADAHGWAPLVACQVEYNLLERSPEAEYLPMGQQLDIAVTAWSPLAGGLLSGKYTSAAGAATGRTRAGDHGPMVRNAPVEHPQGRMRAILDEVAAVARDAGATPAQVSLAWMLAKPSVVIPIFGARSAAQVRENVAATELTLTAEQLERLDRVSAVPAGFPHYFLQDDPPTTMVTGGHRDEIDNHRALAYPW